MEGEGEKKKEKAEECTRQDEGGQARVTRWIEYLRGTPFAWKIERCSSIKGPLHQEKNNELEKRNSFRTIFLSIFSLLDLLDSYLESFSSLIKINQFSLACPFRKVETISDRFEI